MYSTKRKLFVGLASLCFLILLNSPAANALNFSNAPNVIKAFSSWRQRWRDEPTEDEPSEVSEADAVQYGHLPVEGDMPKTPTTPLMTESKESVVDTPVIIQTAPYIPAGKMAEEDTKRSKYDDEMPTEEIMMPVIHIDMKTTPMAGMSSEMPEPFKKDVPLKSSTMGDRMPDVQGSDTDSVVPQLYIQEGTLIPMAQTKEQSSDEKPSSRMKKGDDMSSTEPGWSSSGLLDKEVSTQMETEQVTEAEVQTGDMPQTGRDFLRGTSLGSIRDVVEEQTKADASIGIGITEEKRQKTDEEKAEETDQMIKASLDVSHITETLPKGIDAEETEAKSKSEEHQQTEKKAEIVEGSDDTHKQTTVPSIQEEVTLTGEDKGDRYVQKPIVESPHPSSSVDDVVERVDVPPATPDVSTKVEEGVTVGEKSTESTEISTIDEGEEEISSDKHPPASEAMSSVAVKTELAGKMPSASEDPIRSASPTETPQPESTPELSLPQESATPQPESTPDLSLPQESATPSKQEPITDPGDTEHVEAVERHPPKHSPVHQVEEEQVQVEDQAPGSSATGDESVESSSGEEEKASVAAKAADPSTPTTIDPSTTSSPKQVSTMASLMEFVDSVVGNSTNVKTDVDTPDGRVAILVEEGGELKLEHLEIEPMEGVDVLVKMTGGELKLDDVSIRQRAQPRTLRRALNSEASIKTGLIVDGGAVVSIRNSTFESATDTMVKVTGGSHFSCSDCDFKNNAGDRGGALLVQNSTLHLQECRMTENVANSGGAIHFDGSGSIVDVGASMQIENALFSQNEARGSGASVYMNSAREIRIADTEFRHGSASNGGAVYVQDVHTVRIEQSHFVDNKADESGGGLVAKSIQMLFVLKSTFTNNAALSSFAGAGLLSDCDDATFRFTDFIGNRAAKGGALANLAPSLFLNRFYLENAQFLNNNAVKSGGALLIQRGGETQTKDDIKEDSEPLLAFINSTIFSFNTARMGGAVFVSSNVMTNSDVKISVRRTNFSENKAHDEGGGVYCGEHSMMELSYSSFEHNQASEGMNCAKHCGCQVTLKHLPAHLSDNDVRSSWIQNTCTTDDHSIADPASSNSHFVVYICVTLSVVLVFSIMALVIILKRRAELSGGFGRRRRRLTHRSLSSCVGPSRVHSIMSVPFQREDGDDDAERAQQPSLLPSRTFGEMDYYVEEGSTRQAQTYDHAMYAEEQESASLAQTLSADHAFFEKEFADDELAAPLVPKLANIPEIDSHP